MNTTQEFFPVRALVVMVRTALALMVLTNAAKAADKAPDDAATEALTRPSSYFEIGILGVGDDSYKFGEYNGLAKRGAYGIGSFELDKRSPYESDGTSFLHLRGNNLGLESRDLSLDYGQQGLFKLNLGYDELRRNSSDSYQTPFLGAGTNSLTLPSNWLRPTVPQVNATNLNYRALFPATGNASTLTAAPTAAQLATLQRIREADLPAFHDFNLHSKRTRSEAGLDYRFNSEWGVTLGYKHEIKDGTRQLGAITAFGGGGDSVAIIPELIDSTTDQFNLAFNYTGEKSFGQIAYYGSVFDNQVKSMTWQDPKSPAISPSMSTTPRNQFHEINFTGGFNFTSATKLVVNGAYSRNSQNDTFVAPPSFYATAFTAPAPSADALVITKSANMTLTTRPSNAWNVTAGLKYSDRNNRTPVRLYIFQDVETETNSATAPSPFNAYLGRTLGQNTNIYNNRPQSKAAGQAKLDTDYRFGNGHTIAAGYEWEKIDRSCKGTWIACADADLSKEHTLRAEWRAEFTEDLSTRVSYAHSQRTVNYNENAWLAEVPLANIRGTGAPLSVYDYITQNGLTGFGPLLGYPTTPLTGAAAILTPNNNIVLQRFYGSRNNISEVPGMRRFNLADRNRDKVRASVNWQTTERLSLQGGLDFNRDNYKNSVYGLKNAKDYALNLDSTYVIGEDFSTNAYFSHENQQYKQNGTPSNISNTNPATVVANNVLVGSNCYTSVQAHNGGAKNDPCNPWSAESRNVADTIGFELSKKKMLSGKFDLSGNLSFTRARSDIGVTGGTYVNNPRAATAGEPGVFFIPAENLPRVSTDIIELGLKGEYRVNKSSAFRMLYSYQRLKSSSDFAYEGLQFGSQTGVAPTNERVPTYSVHAVGVSYVYRF
jgi:MtrB/PioB family decaheme-associated outer membrane protein